MSRHQTERREALYCIATSAEGAPLVAGGASFHHALTMLL